MRCCHAMCLKRLIAPSAVEKNLPAKDVHGDRQRVSVEGAPRCSDDQPPTLMPPRLSKEHWVRLWNPQAETPRSRHASNRRYGRCNHEHNVCVMRVLDTNGVYRDHQFTNNCSVEGVGGSDVPAAEFVTGVARSSSTSTV